MRNAFIVVVIILFPSLVFSQEKYSVNDFSTKMQEYFMKPDYDELKKLLLTYYEEAEINKNQSAQMPYMGFFSVAFSEVIDSVDLRNMINNNYSNNEFIVQCYKMSKDIESIIYIDKHEPGINDFYWGAFFASGNKKYIKRITSELLYINEKSSLNLYLAAASAKWSLCSNSYNYALVKKYLLELAEIEPSEIKEQIIILLSKKPSELNEEMVSYLKENKGNFNK